jgi:dipicolinate synthase subunit A
VVEAAEGAHAIIMPLAGIKENMSPNCPFSDNPPRVDQRLFSTLPQGLPVFIGWARQELKDIATGVRLIEIGDDDELAILNSIPTAEGTVAIAMERSPITLHGSETLVVGFGRCAVSLARMLYGIGAHVTVLARKAADLARAHEMGFKICSYQELPEKVRVMDFIFNTVPAMVVTEDVLRRACRCQLVVDIASGKGGTDFEAAMRHGIDAVLAPGLPGKVAPVTAGKILARVYPRFLKQFGVSGR